MKFIFIVGVEGSGQHLMQAFLAPAMQHHKGVVQDVWHNTLTDYWKLHQAVDSKQLILHTKTARAYVRAALQQLVDQEISHTLELVSFPFNNPRDPLRRPDLIDLYRQISELVELKIVVLYRDPVAATFSAFKRGITSNLLLQAKIVEDNLLYIKSQLSSLPTAIYRNLRYEPFLEKPNWKNLADWLELDRQATQKGLAEISQSEPPSDMPENVQIFLNDFFNPQRVAQWQTFYYSNAL